VFPDLAVCIHIMASGNPYGLSEISHFGSFQRVGGKAGGFISKKFFHPSTLRNQEKLWKAQTLDEREQKRQIELERRRDEERQIESLRKEMYMVGQGKASDFAPSKSSDEQSHSKGDGEQSVFLEQEKRRRNMLKQQKADERNTSGASQPLNSSRYSEDIHNLGHTTVWGSWYSVESGCWGYACCQTVKRGSKCPDATLLSKAGLSRSASQSFNEDAAAGTRSLEDSCSKAQSSSSRGDEQGQAASESGNNKKRHVGLIDSEFIEAREKRHEKHRRQEQPNDRSKASEYLADLLLDPALA